MSMGSLSMSPTPMQTPRRLTRRRGSSAATDPFGDYAEQNKSPERKLSSRLTIVRVVPDETSKPSVSDLGEGPSLPAPYPLHTIWASPSSLERRKTFHTPGPHLGPHRLSFASSSFAEGRTPSPPGPPGPPSPPLSPVLRRRSSISSPYMRSPSLTPQQIVELAQSVKYNAPAPHVPETRPSVTPMAVAPATDVEPYIAAEHIEPATFMLIPEGQFLPFVDRPAEVSAFLTTCPTNRLMALLEQAFPLDLRLKRPPGEDTLDPDACPSSFTPSFVTEVQSRATEPPPPPDAFGDPASWSFGTLLDWMCRVPREQVPDAEWVRAIRTCVLEHSEQICVSLLCALGVPMEGLEDLDARRPVLEPEPTRLVVSAPTSPPIPRISISGEEYPPQRPGRGRRRSLSADSFSLERERENLEEEDIFSLDISPMVPSPERRDQDILSTAALQRRAETESTATGRSRLSIAMESIGENEAEEEAATKEEAGAPEVPSEVSTEVGEAEPPSGATTARPTTPVEGEVERIRRELESTPGGRALGLQGLQARVNEGLPIPTDWNGLTIATSPLPAGVPSIPASQLGTPVRLPTISQFAAKRRSSVNVAHVLSGAPGHAGFSWRPGGPLFPVSFASAKEMTEAEMFEAEESRGRERVPSGPRRGRPSLPPRSVRKGYQVPPNSPIEMRKSYRVPPNSPIQYRG